METFERLEGVASISCVANLADSGARYPAPISAKARVCSDNDSAHKCFDLEGPRSSQHRGVIRRHHGRGHRLCFIAKMLKTLQPSIHSHTCSRHFSGTHIWTRDRKRFVQAFSRETKMVEPFSRDNWSRTIRAHPCSGGLELLVVRSRDPRRRHA